MTQTQTTENRGRRTAAQLRALIRNDEALVDHLAPWICDHMEAKEYDEARSIGERLAAVGRRLQARRAELVDLSIITFPAAPASNATLAGALVTTSAAQPGISS